MRLRHGIGLTLLLTSLATARQQTPVAQASIRGTVVDSGDGTSIPEVEIRLERTGQATRRAMTDANGAFQFTDLDAGRYRMLARRAGYLDQAYGNSPEWQFRSDTREFLVSAGETFQAPIRMLREGTISGRIYDTKRAPLSNVRMSLGVLQRRPWGPAMLRSPQSISDPNLFTILTNDRGEYRMTGIPPGDYYVSAAETVTIDGRLQTNNLARTFYPGFRSPERSIPVKVAAGTEISAIDFSLEPVSSLKVSGRIVNSLLSGGQEGMDYSYTYLLAPRDARIIDATGTANTSLPDHATSPTEFEFWNVASGLYDLYVAYRPPQDPRVGDVYYMGRSVIEVTDRDVSGLTVTIESGVDIPGRFVLDDAARTIVPDVRSLSVFFQSMNSMPQWYSPALGRASTVQADGTFVLSHAIAGRYSLITAMNPNLNLYVSSARLGTRDITNQVFEVDGNSTGPLVVEVSGLAGRLEGTVTDLDNRPVSRGRVLLVPSLTVLDLTAYKTVFTDADGRFTVAGIRPGSYSAYAFAQIPEGAWFDPQFMAPYATSATPIDVSRGSQIRRDLKISGVP
jgi:hypothetical protein